jgi:hypothetical protein
MVTRLDRSPDDWRLAMEASRKAIELNDEYHGFNLMVRLYPNTGDAYRSSRSGRVLYLEALLEGLRYFDM